MTGSLSKETVTTTKDTLLVFRVAFYHFFLFASGILFITVSTSDQHQKIVFGPRMVKHFYTRTAGNFFNRISAVH